MKRKLSSRAPRATRLSAWRPSSLGLGCGLATGVMAVLMYPAAALWPLAIVAYVPLLWWLHRYRPSVRQAAVAGLLAGTVLHAGGHYWIAFTMQKMSGMPGAVAWLILLLYGLIIGLHQAIWAGLVAWSSRATDVERPLRRALVVTSLYVVVEFVLPFQFPWFLGNAVYRSPVWLQPADLVGIWGVSALCMMVTCVIVGALLSKSTSLRVRLVAALVVLLAAWYGYGAWRMAAIDALPVTHTARLGIVQPNPTLAMKMSLVPQPRIPMHDRAEANTKKLPLADVDAFIWPEGSIPFYYVQDEVPPKLPLDRKSRAPKVVRDTTVRVHDFQKALGKPLLFGSLRRVDATWQKRARNSAILVEGGVPIRIYDKRKLVAFGEYMPGRDMIPWLTDAIPGISDLEIGAAPALLDFAGAKAAISICYEALFPGFMLEHDAAGDYMINLTDDIWFGDTNAPELHVMVQAPRTVELRRPLVRATATGISTHLDANGRAQFRTGVWTQDARIATVEVRDADSLFRHVGLWPMRALSLAVLVLLGLMWRRRRRLMTV